MRVGDLIGERVTAPVVHPQEPVLLAMRKLAENGQSRLPVVESGRLVGLLCSRDVMDLMEIRAGLAPPRGGPGELDELSSGYTVPTTAQGTETVPR
jgi:CBS domain-containing protein